MSRLNTFLHGIKVLDLTHYLPGPLATLMLAEAANLLMMPGHARDQDRWMADAKLMRDAGAAAFKAAKAKDVKALEAVNDSLYQSCTTCHMHYRPNYGRGAPVR